MSDRPLRVGLNLTYLLEQSGGAGTYARELIPELLEQGTHVTAFASSEAPRWLDELDIEVVRLPVTVSHGPPGNIVLTMGAQWLALPVLARQRRLDVVHGLANVAPVFGVPSVVTVLDLIWLTFPQTMARKVTIGMKLTTAPCAHLCDRVIAISHAGKADICRRLRISPSRVDVTHLGIRPRPDPVPRAPDPLILCVAQKREHKNLLNLIRAVPHLADPDVELVLPGAPTPHEQALRSEAARLGIEDRVRFLGWLSDDELDDLYARARCFVLPSYEEGFGLPILEAMARGTPVACSDASSLPEVAGDAAVLFDPDSPRDIARAIDAADDAQIERGHARVAAFPWSATAAATIESYRRAIWT